MNTKAMIALESARRTLQRFVDKVDNGTARSKETYRQSKESLKLIAAADLPKWVEVDGVPTLLTDMVLV